MHARDQHFIARLCKAYVLEQMQLNPKLFARTKDQAWITVAARLVRQRSLGAHPRLQATHAWPN
jgi:hypothetical protein